MRTGRPPSPWLDRRRALALLAIGLTLILLWLVRQWSTNASRIRDPL